MKKLLMLGVAVAGGAVGCVQSPLDGLDLFDRDADRDQPRAVEVRDLFDNRDLMVATHGRLDGAVGPATGLSHEAEYLDFYSDRSWTTSNLIVRGDQGSAMGIFSVSGDLGELEVGETVRSCNDDWEDPTSPVNTGMGVSASLVGCANEGSPEDGWSYDQPADCTDVTVTEPEIGAPEETVATVSVLAHWGADTGGGQERTVKATIHLAD